MIVINNKSYSIEFLKSQSCIEILRYDKEDWQWSIYNFLVFWFDDSQTVFELKTSGSTGIPKVIKLKKKYITASAKATCHYFNLDETKSALLCLPVKSVGGMMMLARALVSEMKLTIVKPSSNPLKNIDENIDFLAMVPFQVQSTFDKNIDVWKKVDTVIIGGGSVSYALKKDIEKLKLNAFITFGMTETISHIALNKIGENQLYTALENCTFSITKENCLVIKATHLGIEKLETNDIVELVNEKQFIWLGRKDNVIETGGVKILAEIIEDKIAALFDSRFFVSSLPDRLLNNKIILIVEGNCDLTIDCLKPFLDKYECPKEIYSLEKFVNLPSGKLSRKQTLQKIIEQTNS